MLTLISFIALLVSLFSIWLHWNTHEKSKLPYLVINRQDVAGKLDRKYGSSWDKNSFYTEYFSDISMSLINIGATHSVVEKYSFTLENLLSIEHYLKDAMSKQAGRDRLEFTDLEYKGANLANFSMGILSVDDDVIYYTKDIRTNVNFGTVINNNERLEVYLPSYFLILTRYLLMNCKFDKDLFDNLPKLRLYVTSRDIENKPHLNEFSVSWGGSKSITENIGFKEFQGFVVAQKIK